MEDIKSDAVALQGLVGRTGRILESAQQSLGGVELSYSAIEAITALKSAMEELQGVLTELAGRSTFVKFIKAGDYTDRLKNFATQLSRELQTFQVAFAVQQHTELQASFQELQYDLRNLKLDALRDMYEHASKLMEEVKRTGKEMQRMEMEATRRDEQLQLRLRQRDERLQQDIRQAVLDGLRSWGAAATPQSLHTEAVVADLRDAEFELRQHKKDLEADFMAQLAQALALSEPTATSTASTCAPAAGAASQQQQQQQQQQPGLSMQPPDRFLCAITGQVMHDPVQLVSSDGQPYERAAISRWLACNDTNPMTGMVLKTLDLVPNKCLREEIEAWHRDRGLAPPAAPADAAVSTKVASHRPVRRAPPSTPARPACPGQEVQLLQCSGSGRAGVVSQLLHQGVSPNVYDQDGWTPLMCAARHGHVEVVSALLEAHANPNTTSQDGCTAILLAARHGHQQAVECLLQSGAKPDVAANDGYTPLSCAAAHGHVEVVRQLLVEGASVEATTEDGWTPLVLAARWGHARVLELLLTRGARLDVGTEKGFYPLTCAVANGHVEAARVLAGNGAKWSEEDQYGVSPAAYAKKSTAMLDLMRA